jgi:hypothetical protein
MCGFSFPVEIKINKCAQDLRKPFQSTCPSTHGTCSILRTRFNSIASYACYHTGGGTIGTFSARISHSYHRVADSVRKVVKRVKLLGMNVSDALAEPAFHHLRRVHFEDIEDPTSYTGPSKGLTFFDVRLLVSDVSAQGTICPWWITASAPSAQYRWFLSGGCRTYQAAAIQNSKILS